LLRPAVVLPRPMVELLRPAEGLVWPACPPMGRLLAERLDGAA
jgi:hypothetical protein